MIVTSLTPHRFNVGYLIIVQMSAEKLNIDQIEKRTYVAAGSFVRSSRYTMSFLSKELL